MAAKAEVVRKSAGASLTGSTPVSGTTLGGYMPCYKCSNGKYKYSKRGRCQFDTLKACKDAEAAIHAKKSCETCLKKDTEECCLNAAKVHVADLPTLQGAEPST